LAFRACLAASVALSDNFFNELRFYILWEYSDNTMRQIVAAANCRSAESMRVARKIPQQFVEKLTALAANQA